MWTETIGIMDPYGSIKVDSDTTAHEDVDHSGTNYPETSCLFKVKGKNTGSVLPVFDVRNDKKGFPQFLTYVCGQWMYVPAKHFKPFIEEDSAE